MSSSSVGLSWPCARATWSVKGEQDMYDCVAWLYDGFKLPQKGKAA